MDFKEFTKELWQVGILPVVCPENETEVDTLIKAVENTPIKALEITLRHPYAPEAIKRIKEKCPTFTVGAGTVVNPEALDAAISAGADFCVSPGFDEELVNAAKTRNIPFLPGCATPSEIQRAVFLGAKTVKFFPAECMGGTKALKLYKGAFSDVMFVPTGGITMDNLKDYLDCPNVASCGGSFMCPRGQLAAGDSDGIREAILKCTAIRGAVIS
ncbi:MAG: bifunctional 4-hydroxy-2-oxoglutarate aldolase/2-dehydro-3-deoxy-phosphogluconate aldolase [Clostridia bacterium]|nr:bifunctional 4-hydroxy-2-oxoglutarate aldolase/2-dehydro-3-deoxy-phosphogluconate aldolase [Clostridia bacterium]